MRRLAILLALVLLVTALPHFEAESQSTATPIKHVIIIIQENHSFDNLFGTYPFGWPPIINNVTLSVMWPDGLYSNYTQLEQSKDGELTYISVPRVPFLPFLGNLHPYYANSWNTENPGEGRSLYYGDYWFGEPIGFPFYSGPQSMAYFSYQQVGPLWDYAELYVLADNFYSPVMGLTKPNRVAYLTGFPPSFTNNQATNAIPATETIFHQLSEYNVSWKYYVVGYRGGIPWPLDAFSGIEEYKSHFADLSQFFQDLKEGNLPSVSWVMFLGCNSGKFDMHPPHNVTAGAVELVKVINAVMESRYWNSTAIFITFDEGGGYYDHVVPPAIDQYGLGQRVPLLIISPYAKEAFVDNYTMSGYTLLAFIDYNWHLPWLTSYVRDSDLEGLLYAFDFSKPPRPPVILAANNWTYPVPLQYPVHYGYIAKVSPGPSYAQVFPAPPFQFLTPLEALGFALALASIKLRRKEVIAFAAVVFLIVTAVSAYSQQAYSVYSFLAEYYTYTSLIGLLVTGVLAVRAFARR